MNPRSIEDCFLRACWLDVAVRKPGNVSLASAGHRMRAEQFVASARAAAAPLCAPGARVGARIEAAMDATWRAVGCNTNLGILLLCAPLAAAAERAGARSGAAALRAALADVLAALDLDDARAAYRAIAQANPGGLGAAPEQDVRDEPTRGLRDAMALAAPRDRIAAQYASGFLDVFETGLGNLSPGPVPDAAPGEDADAATCAAVQRLFLAFLAAWPDSHIVRKHGEAVAHTVMRSAQGWRALDASAREAGLPRWDEALKAQGINPGTSADLVVASVFAAGLLAPPWHGTC
ncbi:triphosphoribosyl-dephospho-CoA synthase [Piscinibacter sp.]|uniref:triphosphoribosyl-dephospho-CoA synthase n=1 Tax=Piscinibacter sp. TaxID=1903157 RepID=UPI0039E6E064